MVVEQHLIDGCIKGDRKAQYELYNRYSKIMYRLCLRYAADNEQAEDFLQEGFLKIFEKIHSYKGDGSFEGWMKRVIINNNINLLRKLKKEQFLRLEDINQLEIDNGNQPTLEETSPIPPEILLKIVQELPTGYRTVFNLYVFDNFSHKEISQMINTSENNSKSQLFKAKKFIRKRINEYIIK